jgi:maleate cis-trans isomerase
MSSWRARIGKVSPSRGDTYIYEFYQIVPKNILLTVIATTVKKLEPGNFLRAFKAYEEAALTLAKEGAQTLIFGGGPVFVSQERGSEEALCSRLEKATSLSVITEFSSASDASRALGIKRLGIISPFREELNGLTQSYFQEKGFQVPLIRGLGIERNIEIGNLPEDAAFNLTMAAFREEPEVDGFYITCPRWRTAASIAPLEKETGRPVVTTVQANIWSAFKDLGIRDRISGYGELLSSLAD